MILFDIDLFDILYHIFYFYLVLLFSKADADAATQFSDVERLLTQIRVLNGSGVAIGSRHHMQADAVAKRCVCSSSFFCFGLYHHQLCIYISMSILTYIYQLVHVYSSLCVFFSLLLNKKRSWLRNLLMYGFNLYVSILCVSGIKDTQCGFKLFTRKAAKALFPVQHIERWAFDVELLHLCSRLLIPVTEVNVVWTEMSGSKINLFEDIPQMARDILIIRLCYTLRIWSIVSDESKSKRS